MATTDEQEYMSDDHAPNVLKRLGKNKEFMNKVRAATRDTENVIRPRDWRNGIV